MHPCIKSKTTQYFSPLVPTFFHVFFFSIKNLIWPLDPPNVQTPPKKPKTQLQVQISFPKKQKSYYYSPPPNRGNLPFIHGWPQLELSLAQLSFSLLFSVFKRPTIHKQKMFYVKKISIPKQ